MSFQRGRSACFAILGSEIRVKTQSTHVDPSLADYYVAHPQSSDLHTLTRSVLTILLTLIIHIFKIRDNPRKKIQKNPEKL